MTSECCKLYSLIYDPDGKMWVFEFSLGVCLIELCSLVSSLEYLVSNGRQVLLGGIRLGGSTIDTCPPDVQGLPSTRNRGTVTPLFPSLFPHSLPILV